MILQFSKVTFSLYHARYSPFTTLFLTVMFFPCQKTSFVSNTQLSKTESVMYWKEYLPLKRTSRKFRWSERIIKYSLSAVQSSIVIPRTDQPNSGEMMSQPRILILAHSRKALMPRSFVNVLFLFLNFFHLIDKVVKAVDTFLFSVQGSEQFFSVDG